MVDPAGERRAVPNGEGRTERLRPCPAGRNGGNRKCDAALTQAATRGGAQSCVVAVRASIGAAKRVYSEHNGHHEQNDGTSHMSHGGLILADDFRRRLAGAVLSAYRLTDLGRLAACVFLEAHGVHGLDAELVSQPIQNHSIFG